MKLSARNMIKGKVRWVKLGTVNAEVHIESDQGDNLVSVITKESAERLGLKVGMEVFAVIKASNIMIAID